jgi:hypothetical protein
MKETSGKKGRPRRSEETPRKLVTIMLTEKEYARLRELALAFDGNINKLFRALVLGEK